MTVAARGSDAAPAAVTVTVTVSATVAIKAGSRWLPVAPSLRLTFTKQIRQFHEGPVRPRRGRAGLSHGHRGTITVTVTPGPGPGQPDSALAGSQ